MNGTGRREHSPTFLDEETESQSTAEWQNLPVASADLSLRLVTQGSPADLPAPVGTHVSRQLPCSWRCVRVVRGVPFLTTELCGGPGARGCCGTRLVPPPPPASATQPSSAFAAAGRRAGGESGIDGDGRCSPARRWLAGAWLAGSLTLARWLAGAWSAQADQGRPSLQNHDTLRGHAARQPCHTAQAATLRQWP